MLPSDKISVYQVCYSQLNAKIDLVTESIQMLQSSANEETKSSAGDKYETGRAMAQLEIEKLTSQLMELKKQKQVLDQIQIAKVNQHVQVGSLVETTDTTFFLSVSLGKIMINNKPVFCISASSPIGAKLLGLKPHNSFVFQNKKYEVISVS
jgi:transcription elongation GreA/GreB family factor